MSIADVKEANRADAHKPKGPDQTSTLLKLCEDFECFHANAMDDCHVRLVRDGHHEVHTVGSVEQVITLRYLEMSQRAPAREALRATVDTIKARCMAGPSKQTHVRFARMSAALYVDLCDETWRAIEITGTGWRIVDEPPVYFRRAPGALPLPMPVAGGKLKDLHGILNLDREQFVLVGGWVLNLFNPTPDTPFVHLCIEGPAGSTKSSTARALIKLADPSLVPLTGMPKSDDDAVLSAQNCGVLGFDNLSGCRASLSDILCGFSTGTGRKTRTYYETSGLTVESVRVPCLLNGIDAGFMRPDLARRTIVLSLKKANVVRTEAEIDRAFTEMHPRVLGAICDAVATGIRELPNTRPVDVPVMADAFKWIAACGWEPDFAGLYKTCQQDSNLTLLENDQVGTALRVWAEKNLRAGCHVESQLNEWLMILNQTVDAQGYGVVDRRDSNKWPATVEKLAHMLPRIAPLLAEAGLAIEPGKRSNGKRMWRMTRAGQLSLIEAKEDPITPMLYQMAVELGTATVH